jgi:hypothetical protein
MLPLRAAFPPWVHGTPVTVPLRLREGVTPRPREIIITTQLFDIPTGPPFRRPSNRLLRVPAPVRYSSHNALYGVTRRPSRYVAITTFGLS